MARISGIDLPTNKRLIIALTYVFGIGPTRASEIIIATKIDANTKVKDLTESEIIQLRDEVRKYVVEGDLKRRIHLDIRRLSDSATYRGSRHKKKLPVRGQRTHTNARTKRGKRIAIAGKKKVTK